MRLNVTLLRTAFLFISIFQNLKKKAVYSFTSVQELLIMSRLTGPDRTCCRALHVLQFTSGLPYYMFGRLNRG